MVTKLILSTTLLIASTASLFAQSAVPPLPQQNVRNYNVKNSFWFETNIVGKLSKKFQYQLDIQYRRQSDQAGQGKAANIGTSAYPNSPTGSASNVNLTNIFKNGYQFVLRPWFHFFPGENRNIRLSISPLGYWATFGNAKDGFNGAIINKYDVTSGDEQFTYPELRSSYQVTAYNQMGRVRFQARERFELRWIGDGQFSTASNNSALDFNHNFQNNTFKMRSRTMLRADIALKGQTIDDREFYIAASDELFIGLGKNTKEGSLVDQNRAYVGIGYKLPFATRLEIGYLSQMNPKEGVLTTSKTPTTTPNVMTSQVDFNNVLQVLLMFDNFGSLFKKKVVETPKI